MKAALIYVELKTGYGDNGPAWIGKGFYHRTRKTVYFNGHAFCRSKGISGNHIDLETGEEYWISGVKKNGTDRHRAGSGSIQIDKNVIDDYLKFTGLGSLSKTKYEIVTLGNETAKKTSRKLENQETQEEFDHSLRFKSTSELTKIEIDELINYYDNLDLSSVHKKVRKGYIDKLNHLKELKTIHQG